MLVSRPPPLRGHPAVARILLHLDCSLVFCEHSASGRVLLPRLLLGLLLELFLLPFGSRPVRDVPALPPRDPEPAQPPAKRVHIAVQSKVPPDHLKQQIQLPRARFESKITRLTLQPAPDFIEYRLWYLALAPAPLLVVPAAEPSFLHAPQPVAYGGVGPNHHLANAPDVPPFLPVATCQQPVLCDGISLLAD